VPPRLQLSTQRLVIVTGKGGVGKSTVAAALARAAAERGRRVLAVEIGRGGLSRMLGVDDPKPEPTVLDSHLSCVTVEPEAALAEMVHGMLPLGVLARRLLQSTTFQIVAAAAPGLPEYLVLHRLAAWLDAKRLGRRRYQLIVVDAPASGHSLPLLSAPRTLGGLARFGPVAEFLTRIGHVLTDAATTAVWIVTTPEELPIRETIELHHVLREQLGLPVPAPIVNAVPHCRYSTRDEATLAAANGDDALHPYVVGARLEIARQREALAQIRSLHRAVRRTPVRLPRLSDGSDASADLRRLAHAIASEAGLDP
jgi:anion-transporting  ArsA/GET3 family ATPase